MPTKNLLGVDMKLTNKFISRDIWCDHKQEDQIFKFLFYF